MPGGQRDRSGRKVPDPAAENRAAGLAIVARHPLFAPLSGWGRFHDKREQNDCPPGAWATVTSTGRVHLNPARRGEPAEWAWVAAHGLLHLGFDHLAERHLAGWREAAGAPPDAGFDAGWNLAACQEVNRFLAQLKIGRPPEGVGGVAEPGGSLDLDAAGTGGPRGDLLWTGPAPAPGSWAAGRSPSWPDLLAAGLQRAVGAAVDVAGGITENLAGQPGRKTPWRQAMDWFIASYPLLGAIADALTLVEDADTCRAHGIRIAAISPSAAELYVNPLQALSDDERRFVIAHELLHAGLRHDTRSGDRDPWLWNVACDYVINGWLADMGVGSPPDGVLHDPALRGMSSEEVYDRIAVDLRRARKLATLRGVGLGDVLPGPLARDGDPVRGVELDEFYRRALADGLGYHQARNRGLLPAGLVEEIRALSQPPVPWDVELARWFDDHFAPLERRRSYARASRRQSATPGIPRPGWHLPPDQLESRVFGVVLDTSGSMDTRLLGKALGAIASYAVSREVRAARVVFCDAEAHDNGWMHPLDIAGRVRVRGRGGTVLQPGVTLLQEAPDFPKDGPILIITDAMCDRVQVRREHAFLIPRGAVLPFTARGPVFRLS
jgi:predicted metal-dependent peptidase